MTLEEAIKHCEEIVELKYDEGNEARLQEQDKYADECIACAVEHRQLAEWLRELKAVHDEIDDADDDDEIFIGYLREEMWKAITTRAVKKPSKHGTEGRRMTAREAIKYLKDPIGKREQHDEAVSMAIEALRNSPTQMSGTSDTISRQTAIHTITNYNEVVDKSVAKRLLIQLPSTQTEQKKGRWIPVDDPSITGRCSVCGFESHLYEDDVYGYDYCPNCGARLEEVEK